MSANYSELTLGVDARGRYVRVTFRGRQIAQLQAQLQARRTEDAVGMKDQVFTLYETPEEGCKLYVVESLTDATNDVRKPGHRAAEVVTTRTLFSEEAASKDYPDFLEELLKQAKENEELDL